MIPSIKSAPIKQRAYVFGLKPEMAIAWTIACFIYNHYGQPVCRLTEGVGAKHSMGSLHFVGYAIDIGKPKNNIKPIVEELKNALGPDYDVVLEATHIHIEFQPKVGVNQ